MILIAIMYAILENTFAAAWPEQYQPSILAKDYKPSHCIAQDAWVSFVDMTKEINKNESSYKERKGVGGMQGGLKQIPRPKVCQR